MTAEGGLAKGVAELRTLRFSLFGGAVTASGSRADLSRDEPAFVLRARVEHLDLSALPASHWSRGRLDADLALDGHGATWAALAPTLVGKVGFDIADAHVHTTHTLRATIVNPLLRKLADKAKEKKPARTLDMRIARASARLAVASDAVTTLVPAHVETEDGTLTLEGTVGFDGHLAIGGLVVLPPAAFQRATSGKLVPFGDVPVKLRVSGQAGDPDVELLDLGKTVEALAGSGAHAFGLKLQGLFEK